MSVQLTLRVTLDVLRVVAVRGLRAAPRNWQGLGRRGWAYEGEVASDQGAPWSVEDQRPQAIAPRARRAVSRPGLAYDRVRWDLGEQEVDLALARAMDLAGLRT